MPPLYYFTDTLNLQSFTQNAATLGTLVENVNNMAFNNLANLEDGNAIENIHASDTNSTDDGSRYVSSTDPNILQDTDDGNELQDANANDLQDTNVDLQDTNRDVSQDTNSSVASAHVRVEDPQLGSVEILHDACTIAQHQIYAYDTEDIESSEGIFTDFDEALGEVSDAEDEQVAVFV